MIARPGILGQIVKDIGDVQLKNLIEQVVVEYGLPFSKHNSGSVVEAVTDGIPAEDRRTRQFEMLVGRLQCYERPFACERRWSLRFPATRTGRSCSVTMLVSYPRKFTPLRTNVVSRRWCTTSSAWRILCRIEQGERKTAWRRCRQSGPSTPHES